MGKPLIAASIALLLGVPLATGAVLLSPKQESIKAKQAPLDPAMIEGVRQARALQKAGKLKEAFIELEQYAQQGHPTAMFFLAKSYMSGWGVNPDLEEARKLLMQAVRYQFDYRGESAYKLGRLYEQSKGPDCQSIAVAWFRKALEWHYPKAHRQLGIHYEQGLGVDQDIEKAVEHYERASKAGYETISLRLARSLAVGRYGLAIDKARAQELAQSAILAYEVKAANGSGTAAKVLGRLYRDGEFVRQSPQKAAYWLRRASMLGDPGGMHELALLIMDSNSDAAKEALGWLRQASNLGHGGAMTALGRLHLAEKFGLTKEQAAEWFQKGVAAEHGGSMEELARLMSEGQLVPKDMPSAIQLARKGATQGHRGSRSLLKHLLSAQKSQSAKASTNS